MNSTTSSPGEGNIFDGIVDGQTAIAKSQNEWGWTLKLEDERMMSPQFCLDSVKDDIEGSGERRHRGEMSLQTGDEKHGHDGKVSAAKEAHEPAEEKKDNKAVPTLNVKVSVATETQEGK